jgi:hypothetical protein
VTGHLRVADACQVICDWISIHNLQSIRGLPTRFLNTWDLPSQCHLAEQHAGNAELTHVTAGTACDLAPVVHAHSRAVWRELLESLPIASSFQCGTLLSVLRYHLGSLALTRFH